MDFAWKLSSVCDSVLHGLSLDCPQCLESTPALEMCQVSEIEYGRCHAIFMGFSFWSKSPILISIHNASGSYMGKEKMENIIIHQFGPQQNFCHQMKKRCTALGTPNFLDEPLLFQQSKTFGYISRDIVMSQAFPIDVPVCSYRNLPVRFELSIYVCATEHYLEVCAGKLDCTEMEIKWMVHLHFCAVRFSYSHILVVFKGE